MGRTITNRRGMGQAGLTSWQQFQMSKYGSGWSYDPATQILTGPGGYSGNTPMVAPFYQPTLTETSEQILERIYPDYAAFLKSPPPPPPTSTESVESAASSAEKQAAPAGTHEVLTQSDALKETADKAAADQAAGEKPSGVPTWLWVAGGLGVLYLFSERR